MNTIIFFIRWLIPPLTIIYLSHKTLFCDIPIPVCICVCIHKHNTLHTGTLYCTNCINLRAKMVRLANGQKYVYNNAVIVYSCKG